MYCAGMFTDDACTHSRYLYIIAAEITHCMDCVFVLTSSHQSDKLDGISAVPSRLVLPIQSVVC